MRVQNILNSRPRKRLGYMTPKEKFKQLTNLDYNAANIIRLNSDLIFNHRAHFYIWYGEFDLIEIVTEFFFKDEFFIEFARYYFAVLQIISAGFNIQVFFPCPSLPHGMQWLRWQDPPPLVSISLSFP